MNDFLLPNQTLCVNVTIIKFELVWEGKYVTITWLYSRYRKIKIQITFSKVSIQHETHILKFLFQNNAPTYWKMFLASLPSTFTCNVTSDVKLPAYVYTSCWCAKIILMSIQRLHEFHTNWKIKSKCWSEKSVLSFCW